MAFSVFRLQFIIPFQLSAGVMRMKVECFSSKSAISAAINRGFHSAVVSKGRRIQVLSLSLTIEARLSFLLKVMGWTKFWILHISSGLKLD